MADIKKKDINALETWNEKELRKLRIVIKNRLSAFQISDTPKELPEQNPLCGKEPDELKELLAKVEKAERNL